MTVAPDRVSTSAPLTQRSEVWLAGAAALLLLVGSFLPWVKITAGFIGTVTKSGIDGGDGWVTVATAVVAAVGLCQLVQGDYKLAGVLLAVAGLSAGVVGLYEWRDMSSRFAEIRSDSDVVFVTYGVGLYMVAAGAVAAVAACSAAYVNEPVR